MEEEYISFKWAGHDGHLNYLLANVCNKEIFSDATLACDGCLFPVHKLVLAACSDYFCEIFDQVPCKSPVIVLKDTRGRDLMALLEYMYLGRVSLKNADLNPFLKTAESLRIKGLAVSDHLSHPFPLSHKKRENSFKSSRKQKPRKSVGRKVNGIDKNLDNPLTRPAVLVDKNCSDYLKENVDSKEDLNVKSVVPEVSSVSLDKEEPNKLAKTKRKDSCTEDSDELQSKKIKIEDEESTSIEDSHIPNLSGEDEDYNIKDEIPVEEALSEYDIPPLPQLSEDVIPYLNGEPLTLPDKKRMRDSLIDQLINYLDGNQLLMSASKGKQVWGYRLLGKKLLKTYPMIVQEYSMGKIQKKTPIGFLISKLAEKRRNIRKKMLQSTSAAHQAPVSDANDDEPSSTDAGS